MHAYFASSSSILEGANWMSEIPFSIQLTIIQSCKIQHSNLSLLGWYLSEQKALINSWLADVLHRLVEFKSLCIVEYVNSWQPAVYRHTENYMEDT